MKVLVHPEDQLVWDASTEELRKVAMLNLFRYLDEQGYYAGDPLLLVEGARKGNAEFAERLLIHHRNRLNQSWFVAPVGKEKANV